MKTNTRKVNLPDRRQFLKQAASAGLVAGVGPWLASCGVADDSESVDMGKTELRTMYFDLSNGDPNADYYLVAGSRHHALSRVRPDQLAAARAANPMLREVRDEQISHVATAAPLSAKGMQMCFVKGVAKGAAAGSWSMHSMFYHIPSATTVRVGQALARSCGKAASGSLKGTFSTCVGAAAGAGQPRLLAATNYSYCTDPAYDNYKDYFDQAVALVCHHPEVGSFDAATLSYVQQNIVCTDANILNLAESIYLQGPATVTGGWATLVEYMDPVTGLPKLDSKGHQLYFVQHSQETLSLTGAAIASVLRVIKNDPVLGVNITGMQPTETNTEAQGKLWTVKNGTPTRTSESTLQSASGLPMLGASATTTWAASDVSGMSGYSVEQPVLGDANRTVSFTVHNNYIRYLGLYIRYQDGAGNSISYADLPGVIQAQFVADLSNGPDCMLALVNQEVAVYGIPISQATQYYTVAVPDMAASFQILAGGLGRGTISYPNTVIAAAVLTGLLDVALPGLFLAMAASAAYATLSKQLSAATSLLVTTATTIMKNPHFVGNTVLAGGPEAFQNFLIPIAVPLLMTSPALYTLVTTSLEEGEAIGVAEDCLPFGIGLIFQAVQALGTMAQIAETSAEVANAPWTYVTEVKGTHKLAVTIYHDPLDVAGFPAVAKQYQLRATSDGSPTLSSVIQMPATTQTAPLTYTFESLPAGGKVSVDVWFTSADGVWQAGAGSTTVDNTQDFASITIKENLVPLDSSTQYGHKQKIVLDSLGKHVWQAGTMPPAAPALNCNNTTGNLCELVGITLSEPFGAIGYEWKATSAGVRDFASGAAGQLYQFANLSFTQTPDSGYLFSGGGFSSPARLAYSRSSSTSQSFYIDTSGGQNIVRRIKMSAVDTPPVLDLPSSNQAVGKFNFASDAFLVHPTGKLISLNSGLNKLEVLVPSATATSDAAAPLAQAYSGEGTREGLLSGPACMAITPAGAILILEQANNRLQAFDTGANPTNIFSNNTSSLMKLRDATSGITYLDVAMEFVGYIYVLSVDTSNVYTLDIYMPTGAWLCATKGFNAGKLTIDLFRNLYTLNYETLTPIGNVTEPSISQWIPSVS